MKHWPLSIFRRAEEPPNFLTLLKNVAGAAVIGAALPFPFVVLLWFKGEPPSLFVNCLISAIFAVSFYLTCGLPQAYLNRLLRDYPAAIARSVRVLAGALGGALGYSLGIFTTTLLLRVKLYGTGHLGAMLVIEAIIGAIITLIITAFVKLKKDLESSQALVHEKEMRERTLSETTARAQAFALQAQINPHFFFNTLNTISALIPVNAGAAQELIGSLADLFRYTLACSPNHPMTLPQELAFVENYLNVERARFQERLKLELPLLDGENNIRLPGLTLQPLIENAVRYGVARRVEGGWVKVAVERNGGHCRIRVRNQFDPSEGEPDLRPERLFREGHALSNVRKRLDLMYGEAASIEIARVEADWVEATLTVPIYKP